MKKNDVKIGCVYHAKVTNKKVEVRIDEAKLSGGWSATNLATGKKVTIKSAQRLTEIPVGRAKVTKTGNVTVVENEPATVETIVNTTSDQPEGVLKRKPRGKKSEMASDETKEKKLSCMAAALKVLGESNEPMNTKEMIEAMEAKGYWSSPGGKTPHATLYSAILRELAKGGDSRFVKTERGKFTARG